MRELGDLLGEHGYRMFDLHGAPLSGREVAGLDTTARLYCAAS